MDSDPPTVINYDPNFEFVSWVVHVSIPLPLDSSIGVSIPRTNIFESLSEHHDDHVEILRVFFVGKGLVGKKNRINSHGADAYHSVIKVV